MLKQRTLSLLALIGSTTLLGSLILQAALPGIASAAQITSRSLTLQGVGTTGGSDPGGTVNHLFNFTLPTTGTLGSIRFLYCTLPGAITDPCTAPTGLSTSSATLGTSTGVTFSSAVSTAANSIYLTRVAASGGGAVVEQLLGVVNQSTANQTFFVRIASYASTNTTGSPVDTGTVAAAIVNPIQLTGTMPESLVFCTGATIGLTGGVPDCTTATSGAINFNELFTPTDTAWATSQMAASTNAGSGYAITINGTTLTSGSNTITAMNTTNTSIHGVSQFGLNLRADTTPSITTSADVAPVVNGTNYNGTPTTTAGASYGTANSYTYNSGNPVATSPDGTDAQIFTASYIVDVPGSQPAGTYTTTLTYICTPTF